MTSEKNRVVVAGYELTFTIYNSQDYTIRVADISTKILKTSVRFRGESTHMLIIDQDKSLFEPFGPHDIGPRESALVRLCYRIARSHGDIIAFVPVVMCTGPGGILDTIRSDFVCFCLDEGEVQLVRNKDAVSHDDPEVEEFIDEATQSFFATR